jgi:Uncharacterised nucleotidyltransferase
MPALPPIPLVERALTQATEHFAAELLIPTEQAPNWSEFEWSMARAAAVLHGVTPLLAGVLRWRGPQQWESFVGQQRWHSALRHQRIEALLGRTDEQARRAGLAIVALKGAALYRLGVYRGGQRPMADVDLLVAQCDMERACQLLRELGYLDTSVTWKHRLFEPAGNAITAMRKAGGNFGEDADGPIKIDLHFGIGERLPLITADVSEHMWPSTPHPGLNSYPSIAALAIHLLLHAAGNMASRAMRLIHLHDLALLAARMQEQDWAQLLTARGDARALWWAVPPLELLERYYPGVIPAAVLASLRPDCPRALRAISRRQTLSEVSFATLRIEAFPGIAWSTSVSERLSYILGRVIPSRELLKKRVSVTTAEAWAIDDPWSGMSHGKRMLKWIVGRPPRPPAMHAVRRALAEPVMNATHRPPPADANPGAVRMP